MYKTAARLQRFPRGEDGPAPVPCEHAVISWRTGHDNRGEWCVYRLVEVCNGERDMERKFSERLRRLGFNMRTWHPVRVVRGVPLPCDLAADCSVGSMVIEWTRQRKGVNRNADPYLASPYTAVLPRRRGTS